MLRIARNLVTCVICCVFQCPEVFEHFSKCLIRGVFHSLCLTEPLLKKVSLTQLSLTQFSLTQLSLAKLILTKLNLAN